MADKNSPILKDHLQRFIFENSCVRGEIIRLNKSLKTILQQHDYPAEISDLLGQTLCATGLLSATLKFDGSLTIQFQSQGPLRMLVAKSNKNYQIRGTAQWDEDSLPSNLLSDFKNGKLVITLQENKSNKRYQSIVDINYHSISQSLESYFLQSEQLETKLWLAYDHQKQAAAGLLLQKLPDTKDTEHQWEHIHTLANTITDQELLAWDNQTLLHKLFHEETIVLYEPHPVEFYCPCSTAKMLDAIRLLGEKEAMAILSTNKFVEVTCEYCNSHFEFGKEEVSRLFTRH